MDKSVETYKQKLTKTYYVMQLAAIPVMLNKPKLIKIHIITKNKLGATT